MRFMDKIGGAIGLNKAEPIPNDPLGEQRRQLCAYECFIEHLKADIDQLVPVLQAVALKESKARDLRECLHSVHHISWGSLDKSVIAYADAYLEIYRTYEGKCRPLLEKVHFDVKQKQQEIAAAMKKMDARCRLYASMLEAKATLDKKNSKKQELAYKKLQEDYERTTVELESMMEKVLGDSKKFIRDTTVTVVEVQALFYGAAGDQMSRCDVTYLKGEPV